MNDAIQRAIDARISQWESDKRIEWAQAARVIERDLRSLDYDPTTQPFDEPFRHVDAQDGNAPLPFDRETLGRFVREAWVDWARTQSNPKPSWLVPYEMLTEADKEADRRIGEFVARWTVIGIAARSAWQRDPTSVTDLGVTVSEQTKLLLRLCKALPPDHEQVAAVIDYLKRKKLTSPFRAEASKE